jgi:hypothetical protein
MLVWKQKLKADEKNTLPFRPVRDVLLTWLKFLVDPRLSRIYAP